MAIARPASLSHSANPSRLATPVLIIGGGATGTGIARDLALRGVPSVLVDQGDLNAGASGANHGLLHSGARYVAGDEQSATHCREEGILLRKHAAHCIEDTQGLFIAVQGDDEAYIADFPGRCERCGIPARPVPPKEAREREPYLTDRVIAAFEVPDATIDPFKLSLDNMAQAISLGSTLLTHSKVVGLDISQNRIRAVHVVDRRTQRQTRVVADEVVNAAGAWSGEISAMAGIPLDILWSKGTLLITQRRFTQRVVNRLRKPGNADIIVPGGTVSVLGTTSVRADSLDSIAPTVPEVDLILDEAAVLVPALVSARILRAYAGVRPLVRQGADGDDRAVSRDLTLLDHGRQGVENFITITGGKLTTYRAMAEKTADLVCSHLGVTEPCGTREAPLPDSGRSTVPAATSRDWFARHDGRDALLCECEMVPRSVVDEIVRSVRERGGSGTLKEIGLRSRVGKGACQGAFCGLRVMAHLHETRGDDGLGLDQLRSFVNERWKGEQAILFGSQLQQAELTEAIHCALYGFEL